MFSSRDRSVVRSSVIPSAKYCCSRSSLRFVKGRTNDRQAWRNDGLRDGHSGRHARCRQFGDSFWAQCIDPHRANDVLDALLTHVLEDEIELVAHLVPHDPADADPAGLSQGFEPRCYIDAVAKYVAYLNYDIAEIDPDPKLDPFGGSDGRIPLGHTALDVYGAAHRINHAGEVG